MLSVCAALLFTLLLLFVWLWRLGCGLYRWHPAVREVLFLLVAGMLFCWGFRGFTPITWYKLDVSCCSGVGTTPPGMYRPCNGRICRYAMTGAPGSLVIGWWPIASNFTRIIFPGWDMVPVLCALIIMRAAQRELRMRLFWIYPGRRRPFRVTRM